LKSVQDYDELKSKLVKYEQKDEVTAE